MPNFQTIAVSAIDPADTTYRIRRSVKESHALAESIAATGLLNPLTLYRRDDNGEKAIIVAGFNRFEAVRSLGLDTVDCRILSPGEKALCAKIAVAERAFKDGLTQGELVRAVCLLGQEMDPKTMADESMALFNTRLNRGYIETLIRIGQLGDTALALLDSGGLALKTAKTLLSLPVDDAEALISLLSKVRASSGKQAEIITWTREIAARDKTTISALIQDPAICECIAEPQGHRDEGAAANRLRAVLYQKRFPELSRTRENAVQGLSSLNLPKGIRLTLPDNFESTVYTFSVDFTCRGTLDKKMEALACIAKDPAIDRITDREGSL